MKKCYKIVAVLLLVCFTINVSAQELIEINLDNLNNSTLTNDEQFIEFKSIIDNSDAGIAYINTETIKFYNENNPIEIVVINSSDLPENSVISSISSLNYVKVLEIKLDKVIHIDNEYCVLLNKLPNLKFVLFTIEDPFIDTTDIRGFDCNENLMQFINTARPK